MLQKLREELVFLESELDLLKNKKSEIEQDISFKEENLETLKNKIEELHKRLDKINARDKAIYVEKVLLGWSNNKISARHYALTRQQISRIVNNVEKRIRMWPNVTFFFLYLIWGVKMEFKINTVDEDTFEVESLTNKNKLTFKKNVELARKLSNVNADARIKMIKYMKENGITKDDLITKVVKNGKTYYDESSYRLLEQGFINDNARDIAMNIFDILFGLSAEEVIVKLGITNDDEASRLGNEIRQILLGEKTPKKSQ